MLCIIVGAQKSESHGSRSWIFSCCLQPSISRREAKGLTHMTHHPMQANNDLRESRVLHLSSTHSCDCISCCSACCAHQRAYERIELQSSLSRYVPIHIIYICIPGMYTYLSMERAVLLHRPFFLAMSRHDIRQSIGLSRKFPTN